MQAVRVNALALLGTFVSCGFSREIALPVNRSYVSERVVQKRRPASALMLKRLDPDLAEQDLLARVNAKKIVLQSDVFENVVEGYASSTH